MSICKPPAFPMYANDWTIGTRLMTLEERGAYISLLTHQWDSGKVPTDIDELSKIFGCSAQTARRVWAKLSGKFRETSPGFVRNLRLEAERDTQEHRRSIWTENGRKGGRPPANGQTKKEPMGSETETNGFQLGKPNQNVSISISEDLNQRSSTSIESTATTRVEQPSLPQAAAPPPKSPAQQEIQTQQIPRLAGKEPPLSMGLRRLKFWRWMAEDFIGRLGPVEADKFDIEAWVQHLDRTETRAVGPGSDAWGKYWMAMFDEEVRKRGIPLVSDGPRAQTPEEAAEEVRKILRKQEENRSSYVRSFV
jgi:uncharacterized protein YdaU (DUF1376 family)